MNIRILSITEGYEIEIEALVKNIFNNILIDDYNLPAINDFYAYINPKNIERRLRSGMYKLWIARNEEELIGLIEIRDRTHISLFFVDERYQKKGVGKAMFEHALGTVEQDITVNSSTYAVPIYERLGFEKIIGEIVKKGITYIPMIKEKKIKKGIALL